MSEDIQNLFNRLQRSNFRSSFTLKSKELKYFHEKGIDTILEHGKDFISKRLAPSDPPNEGRQTPFGNHPVFIAQHATATCCRGCLEKWHKIPRGKALDEKEIDYILRVVEFWLKKETE